MKEINPLTHVGLIMDGNRRWAKAHGKKSIDGHLAGANRVIELAKHIFKKNIPFLSIYAFSTENFSRSKEEVSYLMGLIIKYFNEKMEELNQENIKVIFSGRKEPLSKDVWHAITEVARVTKENTGGTINICLNYGGRSELVDAVNKIKASGEEVDESSFSKYLYQDLPDLDFVIRTGGEQRLSNFLLWQISYAELYFTKTYFPDFDITAMDEAIEEYENRQRRYGGN